MEQAFQQNLDELHTTRDEARHHSNQHRQEVQTLQMQLSSLEADVARLTASEAMWRERSEKATEQVGCWPGWQGARHAMMLELSCAPRLIYEHSDLSASPSGFCPGELLISLTIYDM